MSQIMKYSLTENSENKKMVGQMDETQRLVLVLNITKNFYLIILSAIFGLLLVFLRFN